MQRRNFLQLLAAVPFVGWMVPKADPAIPYCGPVSLDKFVDCFDVWLKQEDGTYLLRSYTGDEMLVAELPFHVLGVPDYPYEFVGIAR